MLFLLLFCLFYGCNPVDREGLSKTKNQDYKLPQKTFYENNSIDIDLIEEFGVNIKIKQKPHWLACDLQKCQGVAKHGNWSIHYEGSDLKQNEFYFAVIGDPLLKYTWYLKNDSHFPFYPITEAAIYDLSLNLDLSQMPSGKNIEIAISDTGVDFNHADLKNNINTRDSINLYDPSELPYDFVGHGTAVAGIIAAEAYNNLGSRGIAPDSQLRIINFLDSHQTSEMLFQQAMLDVDIFNYSYGDFTRRYIASDSDYEEVLKWGTTNLREGLGAIYVKAAGNEYNYRALNFAGVQSAILPYNANLPQDNESPYLIVVGALNHRGVKASYSNAGSNLWISAFGGEVDYGQVLPAILTTDISGCLSGYSQINDRVNLFEYQHALNSNCDFTSTMNGTSAAAPMISGAVALMLERNPTLTWRDVKYILAKTAKKIDANFNLHDHPQSEFNLSNYQYELTWIKNTADFNYHNWYGFGLIDIDAAIVMASTYYSELGDLQEIEVNWSGQRGIPDHNADGVELSLQMNQNIKIEFVQVSLDLTSHAENNIGWQGEIGVELTSPSGTKSILLNMNNSLLSGNGVHFENLKLLSNAFYQESSQGVWKLKIIDGFAGQTGSVMKAQLNIMGGNTP